MTTIKDILNRAEELFDNGQYEETVELYQQAILFEEPTLETGIIELLVNAWVTMHLDFLDKLMNKYPNNSSIYIQRAIIGSKVSDPRVIVRFCSQGLLQFSEDRNAATQLRSIRFKAAIRSGIDGYLAEDFAAIWESLMGEKSRRKLLQDLLSISDPKLSSAILEINEKMSLSSSIQTVLTKKVEQLELLRGLTRDDMYPPVG